MIIVEFGKGLSVDDRPRLPSEPATGAEEDALPSLSSVADALQSSSELLGFHQVGHTTTTRDCFNLLFVSILIQ